MESWLRQAFHLAAQKNLDAGEYFSAACDMIQALPGCMLLNLYSVKLAHSTTQYPEFSLLGFSQQNTAVLQRELSSFPLRPTEEIAFAWEKSQSFKPFPVKGAPFALYGFEDEKVCALNLGADIGVFYQALWHQARALGAISIAFTHKSDLHAELLKNLQVCAFIFGYLLLDKQFGLSQELLIKQQGELKESNAETQKKLGLWERRVLEKEEKYDKEKRDGKSVPILL